MQQNVTVYTTKLCPVCNMVKDFLDQTNIPYTEVNIDFNPIALFKMVGKTGKFTAPQTNLNGQWISGFDPIRMLEAMNNKSNQ